MKGPPTRSARGQSVIEFALVLPIILLLVVGAVDLGRAFHESVALHGAAAAGSLTALDWQRAAAPSSTTAANAAVVSAVQSSTSLTGLVVDTSLIPWTAGTDYTITVRRTFTFLTPLLGGSGISLQATVHGRHHF